jgi:hypothetical protein
VKNGDPEKVIPGKWFLFIGEENREPGCTTKGHKSRYVPLHPEIVKRLIPYREKVIAEHGHGPLFRHVRPDKNGKRTTYVARKIDGWMDGVIKDPNLAPNHSFRHHLKSQLLDRDVPERISDAITGHKTPGIGRKYEHVEMTKKFKGDQQAAGDSPRVTPFQMRAKRPAWGRAQPFAGALAQPMLRRERPLAAARLRAQIHLLMAAIRRSEPHAGIPATAYLASIASRKR